MPRQHLLHYCNVNLQQSVFLRGYVCACVCVIVSNGLFPALFPNEGTHFMAENIHKHTWKVSGHAGTLRSSHLPVGITHEHINVNLKMLFYTFSNGLYSPVYSLVWG